MTEEQCKDGMVAAVERLLKDDAIEAVVFLAKFGERTVGVVQSKSGPAVPANLLSQTLDSVLMSADGQLVPADGKEPS